MNDLFDDDESDADAIENGVEPVPSRDEYLRSSVEIDDVTQIDGAMMRIPADISYWNNQYAEKYRKHQMLKIEADKLYGRLYMSHRAALLHEHGKATETMIKSSVDMDEDYHDIRIELVDAEAEKVRLRGVCDAVVAKKDMLQSIGAKLRIEMGSDPSVRSMAANSRHVSG